MSAPVEAPAPSHATANPVVINPPSGADLTAKQSTSQNFNEILKRSKNKTDQSLVIREVLPGIVTFSLPFARGGFVPIGGRSTAIRLQNGILIYVSHPHTPATAEVLAGMGGEIKWLVTPDGEHGMSFEQYHKAYPAAQTIGVSRFKQKLPNCAWTGLFGAGGENQKYGFEDEISIHHVSAHPNDELVLHHAATGTLIQADMLFNLPATEQYSRAGGVPFFSKLFGGGSSMAPGGRVHAVMATALAAKDKELFKKQIAPINALKWDRIIPCHGDVIETGGRVAWDKVWGSYA